MPTRSGLVAGDYLLLEQVRSPQTGRANDADPTVRHVVRLVEVEPSVDPVEGNLKLLEVTWAVADALPFDLVVTSAVPGGGVGNTAVCAVAHGNLVLAHHAMTAPDVTLTCPTSRDGARWSARPRSPGRSRSSATRRPSGCCARTRASACRSSS